MYLFRLFLITALIQLPAYASQSSIASYQTLWETQNLDPAEDDPWKHRLFTELPAHFLEHLKEKSENTFSTLDEINDAIRMTDGQKQVRDDLMPNMMGKFVYNPRLIVGSGQEGTVYLAQHIPTGVYAAVKKTGRKSEYTAFKDLTRCYACFSAESCKDSTDYYIFTPLILGTKISTYSYNISALGIQISDDNIVSYDKWPYNLKLIDAYIAEIEYGLKYKAIPQELDSNSMFVVDETTDNPHVVFVDLISGQYKKDNTDLIVSNLIWAVMFKFIGHEPTIYMDELVFPTPIQKFIKDASQEVDQYYISLTSLKKVRNQLMEDMKAIGFPGLPKI